MRKQHLMANLLTFHLAFKHSAPAGYVMVAANRETFDTEYMPETLTHLSNVAVM